MKGRSRKASDARQSICPAERALPGHPSGAEGACCTCATKPIPPLGFWVVFLNSELLQSKGGMLHVSSAAQRVDQCRGLELYRGADGAGPNQAGSKFPRADGLSEPWVSPGAQAPPGSRFPLGTYPQTFLWGHRAEKLCCFFFFNANRF